MSGKRDFLITKDSVKFFAFNNPLVRKAIIRLVEKHKNNPAMEFREKDGVTAAVFYFGPHIFAAERRLLVVELITDFKQALGEV